DQLRRWLARPVRREEAAPGELDARLARDRGSQNVRGVLAGAVDRRGLQRTSILGQDSCAPVVFVRGSGKHGALAAAGERAHQPDGALHPAEVFRRSPEEPRLDVPGEMEEV